MQPAMPNMQPTVQTIEYWPIDVRLTDPFVVATGSRFVAENVVVRVTLADGTQGFGEAAPFPEVGGEDRTSCLNALARLGQTLLGQPTDEYMAMAKNMASLAPNQPAARCALETALIDVHCRTLHKPMWKLWGGADHRERETDITIPICDQDKTMALARSWYARGFRLFKMKVGNDFEHDIQRLEAVHRELPGVSFIGDGNQGFSLEECLLFTKGVLRFGGKLLLLEQPLVRDDLDGLAVIRRETQVPIAADESVRSIADARRVVKVGARSVYRIRCCCLSR